MHESNKKGRARQPGQISYPHLQGGYLTIPDARPERTAELWAHLFEGLQGYLVTFTGQQSSRPDARPNELDDTSQRSWSWPEDKGEAAAYLLDQSDAGRDAYFGVHLFHKSGTRRGETPARSKPSGWTATERECRGTGRSRPRLSSLRREDTTSTGGSPAP